MRPVLSFLILTHNRPKLFRRCIESIINQNFDFEIEILVNNDSNDIEEICLPYIKYSYKSSNNLSDLYKYLYDESKGKYIYFIEDDDYITSNFATILNQEYPYFNDIYYMNFKHYNETISNSYKREFDIETFNEFFQLSQILFDRDLLPSENFPKNNDLDNDWKIFQHIKNKTQNIKIISKPMFIQTLDGKDNISFPHLNKDIRWNLSNKVE